MTQEENPFSRDQWAPPATRSLGLELALIDAAAFIATAMASGLLGNAATQYVNRLRSRNGVSKVAALKTEVLKALKTVKRKPHVSDGDLSNRVEQLFKDIDTLR